MRSSVVPSQLRHPDSVLALEYIATEGHVVAGTPTRTVLVEGAQDD